MYSRRTLRVLQCCRNVLHSFCFKQNMHWTLSAHTLGVYNAFKVGSDWRAQSAPFEGPPNTTEERRKSPA
jgi:hypothetical protein